jgi:hypothetical protein
MTVRALLLLASAWLLVMAACEDAIGCFVAGECTESVFVGVNDGVTVPRDCAVFCRAIAGCAFFTHWASQSYCVAFTECSVFVNTSCTTCVSGEAYC